VAITEETRHHLYQALEQRLGPEEAATLMEHLPPVGWADVATKADVDHLATVIGLRFDVVTHHLAEHDRRFDQLEARMVTREDLATLRSELREELAASIGSLRSEMTATTGELRGDMATGLGSLRSEMVDTTAELRGEMAAMRTDLQRSIDAVLAGQVTFQRQMFLAVFVALVSLVAASTTVG
jgi:hypothetical protein